MTLDDAQAAFEAERTPRTVADYMRTLLEYNIDDMIGDDTFLNGLADINAYLHELAGIELS
jgi:hypothetical protein